MSPGYILGNIIFSLIGFAAWRYASKLQNYRQITIAIILMIFPYFIDDLWFLYGIGTTLTILLFYTA